MMEIIPLTAAREWLKVDDEIGDDLLKALIATAVQFVADFMQRPLVGEGGWPDGQLPAPVVHGIRVALVDLYNNPENPFSDTKAIMALVGSYCRPSFG
ncbi:head-tail connector protein [Sphingomonas paucimobilis]|uniref:head-tail connector protein n=1 Tax=Sphingomonas paucimobilis TaxID=13689 RepID=UPI00064BCB7C|nr:head-tail connector protein [Sphingomonas paucimobilis]